MCSVITRAKQTVIYLHIPKTAGTTLHRIIERQYPPEQIYSFDETHDFDDFQSLTEARKARIRVFKGHMIFGLHELIPEPSTYCTVLRDPVERAISNYHFARHTPQHHHYNLITSQNLSLEGYLESKAAPMMDNGQTRMLSGGWYILPFGECTDQVLEAAKANLRERFAVVGLAERFDETLLLLKQAFCWRNVFYVRQNVASSRPRKADLPRATLDIVEKYNQLDAELYRHALTLFDEQVRRQGPSFSRRVRSFQAANWLLTWPVYVYREIRRRSVREFLRKVRGSA
jgi:hypothetical protein